ncbi:unnamed protein product [Acanthoscelides obtectus]|uniref:Uncharacterized protein n=1 Tax=Acanthoscelides obtectus TaxID=200917 RepID=A0A9P0PQ08_ACAOB|nr:unnamed protein product [Acanthoscelides obtectus]CAK1640527.1 hypothetical protein AOBTE_LOCUS11779 [Acanthoscelides obtectus]
MKVPIFLLSTIHLVLCEVPPPYPRRGFRPHQPLLLPLLSHSFIAPSQKYSSGRVVNGGSSFRPSDQQHSYDLPNKLKNQPQSTYGPPNYQRPPSTSYGVPNKIQSQPQVIYGLPGVAQRPSHSQPQTTYGPPNAPQKVPSQAYGLPSQPQTAYGPPRHQSVPSQTYVSPNQIQNLAQAYRPLSAQIAPSQIYGLPNQAQKIPQTAYGPSKYQTVPYLASEAPSKVQSAPQTFGFQNPQVSPSQQYGIPSKIQVPQTTYGAPDLRVEPLEMPRQAFSFSNVAPSVQNLPHTGYGTPSSQVTPSQNYGAPNKIQSQPQTTYGTPSESSETQNIFNGAPLPQKALDQTYGVPPRTPEIETLERLKAQQFSNLISTSQHLPVKEAVNFGGFQQSLPLKEAGNFRSILPSQQYLPVKESQTFKQGYPSNLNHLTQQYLPVKDAQNFIQGFERNTAISNSFQGDFRNIFPGSTQERPRSHTTVDIQKVDVKSVTPLDNNNPPLGGENPKCPPSNNPNSYPPSEFGTQTQRTPRTFGNPTNYPKPDFESKSPSTFPEENRTVGPTENENRNVVPQGDGYVPPVATTTEKPVLKRPTKSSQTPVTSRPEVVPEQGNDDDENEAPERDESANDGQPNVAIATAVAGGGSRHFYLLQPDGRLQRVTLQKTQETGDEENEYTANYLFQNIEPEPNGVYAPLISLVNK